MEDNHNSNMDLSNWMGNLPPVLVETSLKKLAIPGSHISGAYNLDSTLPLAPGKSF